MKRILIVAWALLVLLGFVSSVIGLGSFVYSFMGLYGVLFKDIDEYSKGQLMIILAVVYGMVLLFGGIGFIALKLGLKRLKPLLRE